MEKERRLKIRRLREKRILRPVVNDEEAKQAYFDRRVPMPDEECEVNVPVGSVFYINGEHYMVCAKDGIDLGFKKRMPNNYTSQRRTLEKFVLNNGRVVSGYVRSINPEYVSEED